jgi:uncharacterized protein
MPAAPNRLGESSSPYLRQHALNPVDWYEWGPEALERAQREGRPILLSIGYAACHWCHVMAAESFGDPGIASYLNEHFVCIKVDREERPDLDEIYMRATQAFTGQGGWPMTVFLTPDQRPFFAGTYFPPEERWGRIGFRTLIRRIAELWHERPGEIAERALGLAQHVERSITAGQPAAVDGSVFERFIDQCSAGFDAHHGGFGSAPKFPPSATIRLLLRLHRILGSERALTMARATLEGMARGGIFDQLGGGFHRYSTDERWLVPHFEKMLYDNALLLRAYLEGFQATGEPLFRQVAVATAAFLLSDLRSPEGAFYSSLDADSEGEEGRYYVWTAQELAPTLDDGDALLASAYFDITRSGNWQGRSVLNRLDPPQAVAARTGLPYPEVERRVLTLVPRLLQQRRKRPQPRLDDKVLAGWNGLAIGALSEAAFVLGDRNLLSAATRAADFLCAQLLDTTGRLSRGRASGGRSHPALLEDYAYVVQGLLDLYEIGGEMRHLAQAARLGDAMVAAFRATDGAFHSTANDHERLIVRFREGHDGATPSPNAIAALSLLRLARHTGRDSLAAVGRSALDAYGQAIAAQPAAFASSLLAALFAADPPTELVLLGVAGAPDLEALETELRRQFIPNRLLVHRDPSEPDDAPLLRGKTPREGQATLYVCKGETCLPPLIDAALVAETLSSGWTQGAAREAARSPPSRAE